MQDCPSELCAKMIKIKKELNDFIVLKFEEIEALRTKIDFD
jgi:hypothetical protein